MNTIASLGAWLVAAAAALPAQCLVTTVTTQTVGTGCNVGSTGYCKLVGVPTTTTYTLDVTTCTLDAHVNLFEACGVVVPVRAVVIGFQQVAVPLPDFGVGCMLHVAPDIFLTTGSGPVQLMVPLGLPGVGFFAQSVAFSVAPPGGAAGDGFTFSDAALVIVQ
ncbi:MAG: hypothetical protein JNL08_12945 [Planctomycetes bacterium]|nr:hypothetical protein [Planctomycetota bacterium]